MNEHAALTSVSLSRCQVHLLEQLNDEEFWRCATEIATSSSTIHDQVENYLVCNLGTRRCIFPPGLAGEIIPPPHQLTLLPAVPPWMPGLTVWRGEMIALVDLRAYLWGGDINNTLSAARSPDLLLVVQFHDLILGLLVTAVATMISWNEEHMVPFELAPDWCSELRPGAIRGVLDEALVLTIPFIFNDIVQQIKEYSPQ